MDKRFDSSRKVFMNAALSERRLTPKLSTSIGSHRAGQGAVNHLMFVAVQDENDDTVTLEHPRD